MTGEEICRQLRDQARRLEEEAAYSGADPDLLRAAAAEIERLCSDKEILATGWETDLAAL